MTFTPPVAELVRAEYCRAGVILEYGSGGSTVFAAKQPGTRIFSVETDRLWARRLETHIAETCPGAQVTLHHADIGPTKEWGLPARYSRRDALRYLRYARSVWNRPDFVQPDLVLIDGRFRISCFFVCLSRLTRPTRILFDDFTNRPAYHCILQVMAPTKTVDRMAVFDVVPGQVSPPSWGLHRLRAELLP